MEKFKVIKRQPERLPISTKEERYITFNAHITSENGLYYRTERRREDNDYGTVARQKKVPPVYIQVLPLSLNFV